MVDPGRVVQNLPKGNFMQRLALIALVTTCDQEASVLSCGRRSLAMSAPDVGLGFCRKLHSLQLAAAASAYHAKHVLSLAFMTPACLPAGLGTCEDWCPGAGHKTSWRDSVKYVNLASLKDLIRLFKGPYKALYKALCRAL